MSLSDTYEDTYLDYILSTVKWAGLSTADPTDDGSGLAEPSGNAYARVEVPSSYWNSSSGGSSTNSSAITFPTATGSWGTVTHIVLFDDASASDPSNIVMSAALDASLAVVSGMSPNFKADALTVSLD